MELRPYKEPEEIKIEPKVQIQLQSKEVQKAITQSGKSERVEPENDYVESQNLMQTQKLSMIGSFNS